MPDVARLRWRLAGATMWPAYGLSVALATALLHRLPFAGERGLGLVPAFLLSGVLCLVVVAVGAPLGGWLLRRRDPALPKLVADDRAGTALLAALVLALLAGGLAHRPMVEREKRDLDAQAAAARRAILARAPAAYRANVDRLDTVRHGPRLYRTCAPGPDPDVAFCVIVRTDRSPPRVAVDADRRPNAVVSGPRNPGRFRG